MSDLISRQAAIDALHMHLMYRMGTDSNKKRLDEWINNLPSAQPKHGKWEYHSNPTIGINPEDAYCSCCGFHVDTTDDIDFDEYKFCPCCGADMRGGKQDG